MADYKMYRLDGRGQIAGAPLLITASDDESARLEAEQRREGSACELWLDRRMVARLDRNT